MQFVSVPLRGFFFYSKKTNISHTIDSLEKRFRPLKGILFLFIKFMIAQRIKMYESFPSPQGDSFFIQVKFQELLMTLWLCFRPLKEILFLFTIIRMIRQGVLDKFPSPQGDSFFIPYLWNH